jgi:fucose 4-O-acetylase-like acetyltransferase
MDWGIPMWFLPALFLTTISSFFIVKLKLTMQIIVLFLLGTSSWYYSSLYSINLPWSINIVFSAIIFFFAGYWFRKLQNKYKLTYNIHIFIIFITIHTIGFMINKPINMYYAKYGNYILFILNGITGSL